MSKKLAKPAFITLFLISVAIMPACKKSKEQCPLQTYKIECTVVSYDAVFGGYNTSTQQSTIESNCPEDAQKIVEDMSYSYGFESKRCRIVP